MPSRPRLRRPSPALIIAFVALVLTLGGTSYAVVKPGRNTVGSRELRKNAVTGVKIKSGAVDSSKVRDDSLTGQDINEASLTGITTAQHADRATAADRADAVSQVVYRTTSATIGPAPADLSGSTESAPTEARCPENHRVLGGGVQLEENMSQVDGFPSAGGVGWTVRAANDDVAAPHTFTVYAICVAAATIG